MKGIILGHRNVGVISRVGNRGVLAKVGGTIISRMATHTHCSLHGGATRSCSAGIALWQRDLGMS